MRCRAFVTLAVLQAGFGGCIDTEQMLEEWIRHAQRERYVPTY